MTVITVSQVLLALYKMAWAIVPILAILGGLAIYEYGKNE